MLDRIAKRYSVRPSEVVDSDLWKVALDYLCCAQGMATAAQTVERMAARKDPVFPAVLIE